MKKSAYKVAKYFIILWHNFFYMFELTGENCEGGCEVPPVPAIAPGPWVSSADSDGGMNTTWPTGPTPGMFCITEKFDIESFNHFIPHCQPEFLSYYVKFCAENQISISKVKVIYWYSTC